MNVLFHTVLTVLSNVCSLITIGMCLVAKVPQIRTLYNQKSARGISPLGLYLDTLSYTITMSYNYCNEYSLLSYMEYPVLLVQNYVLIGLVLYYKRQINQNAYTLVSAYFGVTALLLRFAPAAFLAPFVPLCTPIGALAKIMVIVEILRSQDSSNVNLTTWFISAFTNLTRIFTIYVESADPVLLFNFYVSTLLSSAVWTSAWYFKRIPAKK